MDAWLIWCCLLVYDVGWLGGLKFVGLCLDMVCFNGTVLWVVLISV